MSTYFTSWWSRETLLFMNRINHNNNIGASASVAATPVQAAIASLADTVTGDRIAIGTANGTILVCQKGIPIPTLKRTIYEPSAGTFTFFTRGMNDY
jgi:hypothetical protein